MQLLVPVGTRLGKRRLHYNRKILDLNVKNHLARYQLTSLGLETCKLFDPVLEKLFKPLYEDFFDFFV